MAEAISRTILQPYTEPTMQRGNDTADEADFAESTLARPNRNDRSQNTSEPTSTSELRPTARMRTIRYGALAQAPVDAQSVVCGLARFAV